MKNRKIAIIVVCLSILLGYGIWLSSDPYAIKQETEINYPYYIVQTKDGLSNPYDQSTEDVKYAQDGDSELQEEVDAGDLGNFAFAPMYSLYDYNQSLDSYITMGLNGCGIQFIGSNGIIEDFEICTGEESVITDYTAVNDQYIAVSRLIENEDYRSIINVYDSTLNSVTDIYSNDMILQAAIAGDNLYYLTSSGEDLEQDQVDNKLYQYNLSTGETELVISLDEEDISYMTIIGYEDQLLAFYDNLNKIREDNTLVQELGVVASKGVELIASDITYMEYSTQINGDVYFWGFEGIKPYSTIFKYSKKSGLENVVNLAETESLYSFSNNGFVVEDNEMYTVYDYQGNLTDSFELENEYKTAIGKEYSYNPVIFV